MYVFGSKWVWIHMFSKSKFTLYACMYTRRCLFGAYANISNCNLYARMYVCMHACMYVHTHTFWTGKKSRRTCYAMYVTQCMYTYIHFEKHYVCTYAHFEMPSNMLCKSNKVYIALTWMCNTCQYICVCVCVCECVSNTCRYTYSLYAHLASWHNQDSQYTYSLYAHLALWHTQDI